MDTPLENPRHEKFAVLYSGECFGYAGKAYAKTYGRKCDETARVNGSRLLSDANIRARVKYLREQLRSQMAIDAAEILKLRLDLAKDKRQPGAVKVAALKDVERSLGLEVPEKHELDVKGSVIVVQ